MFINLFCYLFLLNEISENIFVNFCFQESQVDAGEVQEKIKEVICKTITNIPLSEASSRDRLSDAVSWHFYFSNSNFPYSGMVATGQEIVREKKNSSGQGKVREFHFESGKIYIFEKSQGKVKF